MREFTGFPAGKVKFTPLPNLFFSELLPAIDDLAELKVTLHVFWLLHRKRGHPRYVTSRELSADGVLLKGLMALGKPPEEALQEGLERGVARGTLLRLVAETDDGEEQWYFLNTDDGRRTVAKIKSGALKLGVTFVPSEPQAVERPNIFVLYEQNIGMLSPIIAEELRDAEQTYPDAWIEEAFRIAVERNARNWRYVRSILERWATRGKDDGLKKDRRRYIKGKYAEYIEH